MLSAKQTDFPPDTAISESGEILAFEVVKARKGAYFTPEIWVKKAHKAISEELGADWQNKYYVWDCAAGTGNLLIDLKNKKLLWASTLDKNDIDILKKRGVTYKTHAFQFDFLNDSFEKLPKKLREIIEKTPEQLVILINPPYAEVGSGIGKGEKNKEDLFKDNAVRKEYSALLGKASNELSALFFMRIWQEIRGCILAEFSPLKVLQSANFRVMRKTFKPKLLSCFLVPGNTFENVKGHFPIGFKIWNTGISVDFGGINVQAFNAEGKYLCDKILYSYDIDRGSIKSWLKKYNDKCGKKLGVLISKGIDFSNQQTVRISHNIGGSSHTFNVTLKNLLAVSIYFAVNWAVEHTWLNDRDQFLAPNTEDFDKDFENNCLIYSVFSTQNHISVFEGANHWIPFLPEQVGYNDEFEYDTVCEFLRNRGIPECLGENAVAVYNAGLEIFKYYHSKRGYSVDGLSKYNPNASLYDIRAFFQGRNKNGKINVQSSDTVYQGLIEKLREMLKNLRDEDIAPMVYKYGFLL